MLILPCREPSRQGIWRSRHARSVGLKELMLITIIMMSLSSFDGYAACIIPACTITAKICFLSDLNTNKAGFLIATLLTL
jgi:hypothetical protein